VKLNNGETETFITDGWAKAGKDSRGRNKATRSEGDDLGDSAARAHGVEVVEVGAYFLY